MIGRIFRHLCFPRWRTLRAFPPRTRRAIEAAVKEAESRHAGELRFVVEGGLDLPQLLRGVGARRRAAQLFKRLRLQDTRHASGVLVYVQMADRQVDILADRGIDAQVGQATWQRICGDMEQAFRAGQFEAGALLGIQAISAVLAEHFPAPGNNPNELPDRPLVL